MFNIKTIKESNYDNIYIVGDIHGMFHLLEEKLEDINFNKNNDLLICTGDLIDRGKNSHLAPEYLKQDWFISVFGNHDIKFMNFENKSLKNLFPPKEYFDKTITEESIEYFKKIYTENLFAAIEVNLVNGEKIGILHAGMPLNVSWEEFKISLQNEDYNAVQYAIWSRDFAILRKLQYLNDIDNLEKEEYRKALTSGFSPVVSSLDKLSCNLDFIHEDIKYYNKEGIIYDLKALVTGHSILNDQKKVLKIANRYFIDTGGYLKEPFINFKGTLSHPNKNSKYDLTLINIKSII